MLVIPSQPGLLLPRFGSWWRLPFRNPLASFLKYASGGHLAYKPSGGHLVWSCVQVCTSCDTGTTPASLTVSLSNFGICASFPTNATNTPHVRNWVDLDVTDASGTYSLDQGVVVQSGGSGPCAYGIISSVITGTSYDNFSVSHAVTDFQLGIYRKDASTWKAVFSITGHAHFITDQFNEVTKTNCLDTFTMNNTDTQDCSTAASGSSNAHYLDSSAQIDVTPVA